MTNQQQPPTQVRATPVLVGENNNGVIPGTRAAQQAMRPATAELIRRASANEDEYLEDMQYATEGMNGYLEPVSIGNKPYELWARTYVRDFDEAAEFALEIALETDWTSDIWAGSVFHNQDCGTNAVEVLLVLRKSIGRMSLWEALMGQVGMVVPEIMRTINDQRVAFRRNEPNYK